MVVKLTNSWFSWLSIFCFPKLKGVDGKIFKGEDGLDWIHWKISFEPARRPFSCGYQLCIVHSFLQEKKKTSLKNGQKNDGVERAN